MTKRAGLVPTVITNKNNVRTTVYRKPESDSTGTAAIPAPKTKQTQRTFHSTLREFDALGLSMKDYPIAAARSIRKLGNDHPDVLDRVMDAITVASPETRAVWGYHFANSYPSDSYTHRSGYEHLIANAELNGKLIEAIGTEIIQSPRYFKITELEERIESATGISPGHERYGYVQAAIIYVVVTTPNHIPRVMNESILTEKSKDIQYIEDNLDRVMLMLPELCKRSDASYGMVASLLASESPSLREGAL